MVDPFQSALRIALRRLQTSDRFESEVRLSLAKFSPAITDRVVAYLKSNRFLDDERTASTLVEFNRGRRSVGSLKIQDSLERRGVAEDLIAEVVQSTKADEPNLAKEVLMAKYAERNPADRSRAGRFLFSRGFEGSVVDMVLEEHFGPLNEDW